jgi:uncharacterized membrane protein
LLLGAALMYYADPVRGRARRARIRDLLRHVRAKERRFVGKAARDAHHRAQGVIARVRNLPADAGPEVREARARAIAGHADGRRGGMWPPSVQLGAIAAGAVMATWGLLARRGVTGAILATAGSALAVRGGLNMSVRDLVEHAAGRRAIEIQKTVTVRAPIDRVFGLWRHVENFPRFMQHVQDVIVDEADPMKSKWIVDGPAGRPLEFESAITRVANLREICWRTAPGQIVEHAGIVRFDPVLEGTRVTIRMSYRPPGGAIGHAIAHVLGWDPKARIDDDMVRMKALLEMGTTRAHGSRVAIKDLLH